MFPAAKSNFFKIKTHVNKKSSRPSWLGNRPSLELLEDRVLLSVDAPTADLNDDGVVNILDFSTIVAQLGTEAGEEGYLEGYDLKPDGTIDFGDLMEVRSQFGQRNVETGNTVLVGRVMDDLGNPIENVRVQVGTNSVEGFTDASGIYNLNIPESEQGVTEITFDGSTAFDPTPFEGSGQFPTIPHKPIFINGGKQTRFRDMSLPERDLHGSVDLQTVNADIVENPDGTTTATLNEEVTIDNAGVKLIVPAGAVITFPAGEDPVLSITRVDPARLPIPMPPGLNSSLFVTYQPGGTMVDIPGGGNLITEFDNTDLYDASHDADPNTPGVQLEPGLAGVVNGIFAKIGTTELIDADNDGEMEDPDDILQALVPTPFDFAWYHVDIQQDPCPRTIVTGQVKDATTGLPIADAWVSVPGIGPVPTDGNGEFTIFNVPAGPNGPACFTNPFTIQATASKDINGSGSLESDEVGSSDLVPAVPGGITDVGMIFIGEDGGRLSGSIFQLTSTSPFLAEPVEGADVKATTTPGGFTFETQSGPNGEYNLDIPVGSFVVDSFFDVFFQTASDEIGFPGDVIGRDFNFVANGLVDIEIVELSLSGPPVAGANVNLFSFEDEDLGGGFFSPPDFEFGTTDPSGRIDGVQLPLGGFTAEIEGREILEVYQDGVQIELTELSLQSVEPITVTFVASEPSIPGDIEEVQFSSVTENEGDLIQIDIFYTQPLAGAIIGGADFIIEIDADQNANTGSTSEIAFLSGGQTNLGVDFILFGSLFGYEGGFVDVFERNSFDFLGSGVIFFGTDEEDEMDFSHVIIQVPQVLSGPEDELFDLFGGDTQANIALLSTVNLDFGGEFEIFEAGGSDVVPGDENGANGFMNVDLAGILGDLVFQDDTDDTFEIFDLA